MTSLGQVCPPTSLNRFPNGLGFGGNQASYTSLPSGYQPLDFRFNWAPIYTMPTFRDSSVAEIITNAASQDTLEYQKNMYTLRKIQLTNAAHKSWLIPLKEGEANFEDIVFTYVKNDISQEPQQPKQIIIVVPILRSQTDVLDPDFFKKLVTPTGEDLGLDPAAAVSLAAFFPPTKTSTILTNTIHAYYTFCVSTLAVNETAQDILVVIQTGGLKISEALMLLVRYQFNNAGTSDTVYGAYEPITGTSFSPSLNSVFSEAEFAKYVKYAYNLGEQRSLAAPDIPIDATKEMAVDAYKCVPFDPETQINKDGKVVVDTDSGKPLSDIEKERAAAKNDAQQTNLDVEKAEQFIQASTTALGVIIGVVVIGILLYILLKQGGGVGTVEETSGGLTRMVVRAAAIPTYLILSVLFGIIGFIIGFVMRRNA